MGTYRGRVALGSRGKPAVPRGQEEADHDIPAREVGADVSGTGGSRDSFAVVR